jgi:uncharacterized protein YjbI with pentapeptide repeats
LANPDHLAKLKEGVELWNQWRKENPELHPDLSEVDLTEENLHQANLGAANLKGASLAEVNLCQADLSGANLTGAYLGYANLSEGNLIRANLTEATLYEANLAFARFSGANLAKAILSKADLTGAELGGADLSGADLLQANLSGASFGGAKLVGVNLKQAMLISTDFVGANLTGCSVYGIAAWNLRTDGANQSDLVITPDGESPIQVDNLEVAQFIYLILNNQKIRDVIDTIGKKAVLILGRFTPERKAVLDAIREALRHHGYLPILFDFEKPSTRDTQETIVTLAGLARFIIADITDPKSIPQELAAIVPNLPSVPVQPVLQTGYEPWGMYDHITQCHWLLPLVRYEDKEALLTVLETRVIVPAEEKAREQTRR